MFQIRLTFSLAVLPLLLALSLRADTIELKTGEHIEGAFKQATSAGAVIEVGGQAITIPLEKVKAIYFGAAPSGAVAGPAPSQEALNALRALRSVTKGGIALREYSTRLLDTRVKVDQYLAASANDSPGLRSGIETAMRLYEMAGEVWDIRRDLSAWKNPDPELSTKCPAIGKMVSKLGLAMDFRTLGMVEQAEKAVRVDGQPAPVALWTCASAQIAEAEQLTAPR